MKSANRDNNIAVEVKGVIKDFKLPHDSANSIKSLFVNPFSRRTIETQHILRGVSFDVKKGEFFGIVGRNGCGKSTLLKMIAGIYSPDKGSITVNGRISPFLELGVGFNPELTGRENVYLNGALLGLSTKEVDQKYDAIVGFAELEAFMDQKLNNYSSGMQVRLAFSVAIHVESEILLIDEVLAVGDENFQRKCFEVFESFKREGKTIIFVSHSMSSVKDFCDRAVLIDKGEVIAFGNTERIVDKYSELNRGREVIRLTAENSGKLKAEDDDVRSVGGTRSVEITDYEMYDHNNKKTFSLETGKKFRIQFKAHFTEPADNPVYAAMFRKNPKDNLYGINSFFSKEKVPSQKSDSIASVVIEGVMPLSVGHYYLTLAVADQSKRTNHTDLIVLNNYIKVSVYGAEDTWGLIPNENRVKVEKA